MSEQTHTFACAHCDYNVMGPDADAIADDQFRHEDFHALKAEFAAKKAIPAADLEHYTDLAGETTVEQIAEGEIVDTAILPTGTGIRVRLDRFTDYDNDGDEEGNYYRLSVDKPHGTKNSPELSPGLIPDLIAELARLHWIWKRRQQAEVDQ